MTSEEGIHGAVFLMTAPRISPNQKQEHYDHQSFYRNVCCIYTLEDNSKMYVERAFEYGEQQARAHGRFLEENKNMYCKVIFERSDITDGQANESWKKISCAIVSELSGGSLAFVDEGIRIDFEPKIPNRLRIRGMPFHLMGWNNVLECRIKDSEWEMCAYNFYGIQSIASLRLFHRGNIWCLEPGNGHKNFAKFGDSPLGYWEDGGFRIVEDKGYWHFD